MKNPAILGTLVAVTMLQTSAPAFANERVGNIIGGIIGGVIGSQIGGGNGRTAATIIGAIAGTMIGGQIGRNLEEGDRRALDEAQHSCLRGQPGASADWDGGRYGSRSGARGRFTSTREGYNQRTGETCREYRSEIYIGNRHENTSGIACSRSDGSWYEARHEDVSYDRRHNDGRHDGRHGYPGRPNYPNDPYRPIPAPPAPYPGQNQASVQINGISRRPGGNWYRLTLQRPLALSNIEVRVLRANLKIHEGALFTANSFRIPIYELANSPILVQGQHTTANINRNDRIVAIDIRTESFGDFADIVVTVSSPEGYPYISVTQF